jgi:hypothetical protein
MKVYPNLCEKADEFAGPATHFHAYPGEINGPYKGGVCKSVEAERERQEKAKWAKVVPCSVPSGE